MVFLLDSYCLRLCASGAAACHSIHQAVARDLAMLTCAWWKKSGRPRLRAISVKLYLDGNYAPWQNIRNGKTREYDTVIHHHCSLDKTSKQAFFNDVLQFSVVSSNAKTPLRSKPCDQVWQLPFSHGIRSKGKKFTASIWCFARIKWKRFKKGYIRKRHWGLRSWPHASCQLSQQGSQPWIINNQIEGDELLMWKR